MGRGSEPSFDPAELRPGRQPLITRPELRYNAAMRTALSPLIAWVALLAMAAHATTNFVTPTGSGDGSSWTQASSLSNALLSAGAGDELWLASGTYTDTNTFVAATTGLTLYGGFTNGMASLAERDWTAHPVLLDGQATRRVISISATNVALDGLVVAGPMPTARGFSPGLRLTG